MKYIPFQMPATTPHHLPEPVVDLVAQRFRLLGEPMRIRLLDHLRTGEQHVCELATSLGTTQQNVSKHLGALHRAGLVHRRKEGNHVVYTIADGSVFTLCEHVCDGIQRQATEIAHILELPISHPGRLP